MELTFANTFFLIFGILIGTIIGYLLAGFRITHYLKKYYPDVDFQQTRKERKKILNETKKEKE